MVASEQADICPGFGFIKENGFLCYLLWSIIDPYTNSLKLLILDCFMPYFHSISSLSHIVDSDIIGPILQKLKDEESDHLREDCGMYCSGSKVTFISPEEILGSSKGSS